MLSVDKKIKLWSGFGADFFDIHFFEIGADILEEAVVSEAAFLHFADGIGHSPILADDAICCNDCTGAVGAMPAMYQKRFFGVTAAQYPKCRNNILIADEPGRHRPSSSSCIVASQRAVIVIRAQTKLLVGHSHRDLKPSPAGWPERYNLIDPVQILDTGDLDRNYPRLS